MPQGIHLAPPKEKKPRSRGIRSIVSTRRRLLSLDLKHVTRERAESKKAKEEHIDKRRKEEGLRKRHRGSPSPDRTDPEVKRAQEEEYKKFESEFAGELIRKDHYVKRYTEKERHSSEEWESSEQEDSEPSRASPCTQRGDRAREIYREQAESHPDRERARGSTDKPEEEFPGSPVTVPSEGGQEDAEQDRVEEEFARKVAELDKELDKHFADKKAKEELQAKIKKETETKVDPVPHRA